MPLIAYRPVRLIGASLGGALVLTMASTANADPIVHFQINVSGGDEGLFSTSFDQIGVSPVNGDYKYTGNLADLNGSDDWGLNWNFTADNDPVEGAKIGNSFTFENKLQDVSGFGNNHMQVEIIITLGVAASQDPTSFLGNAGATLNITQSQFGNAGVLTTVGGDNMWTALINGADAASLFTTGSEIGGSNGPSTAQSSQNLSAGQLASLANMNPNSIGIRLHFDVTPGETVGFTGVFGFIPGPGALALLGLAGMVGRSRRRA